VSTQLALYEAARGALAAAVSFDEVTKIIDRSEQLKLYARQAKETDLIDKATELRMRAERRAGEMLQQAAERGERATRENAKATRGNHVGSGDMMPPTLAEIGVTRDESSRYQRLAAMPAEHFETAIESAKETGTLTAAAMLREANKGPQQKRPRAERIEEMRLLAQSGHLAEQIAVIQGIGVEHARYLLNEAGIKIQVQKRGRGIDSNKIVRESVAALSGLDQGLSLVGELNIDALEAAALLSELRSAMKALRTLETMLKEIVNGK